MVAVGEAAFEVRLERVGVRLDIPASIGKLGLQEPGDALLIGRRGWFHIGRGVEGVEGEAGGVGVRRHIRELRPASIAVLAGEEIIDRRFDGRLGGGETDQKHSLFFDAAGRLRAEPRAGVIEPGGDFSGAAGRVIGAEGGDGHRGGADIRVFTGRAVGAEVPLAVRVLAESELVKSGIGVAAGGFPIEAEGGENVHRTAHHAESIEHRWQITGAS